MKKKNKKTLSDKLAFQSNLRKAWKQIYSNGSQSSSKQTKTEVEEYKKDEERNLRRLSDSLREGNFSFKQARGVLITDKKRPIVLADVESRIVQRALLDLLQSQETVQQFLNVATSFGAIKNKGVPLAISAAKYAIADGATWYLKSDIKSFFTRIKRQHVLDILSQGINDPKFIAILDSATNLEISNIETIPKDKRDYFDFEKVGTPQGAVFLLSLETYCFSILTSK
jgi:RNA-directed DNA polymerase